MKTKTSRSPGSALILLLVLGITILVSFKWWDQYHELPPVKNPVPFLPNRDSSGAASSETVARKSVVVVSTGEERVSNAVRCLAYMVDLANQLPAKNGSAKPMLMAGAGIWFFQDCLMSKMSNGYINITTNELRQKFSNAVAELYSNNVPPGLAKGFNDAFDRRNNLHQSVDGQYEQLAQYPNLAPALQAVAAAFQNAGITDAPQSDLKEICLGLCSSKTTAYLMYGPSSANSLQSEMTKEGASPAAIEIAVEHQKESDNSEYHAIADSLDSVLAFRLTHLYELDGPFAEALVRSLSGVPVTQFSFAGLQVPAYIE